MYQKSYSLNPNNELYEELNSIKSIDTDIDLNEDLFKEVCLKEDIPLGFNKEIEANKNIIEHQKETKEMFEV